MQTGKLDLIAIAPALLGARRRLDEDDQAVMPAELELVVRETLELMQIRSALLSYVARLGYWPSRDIRPTSHQSPSP